MAAMIIQPAGLGDIIFCLKIAFHLVDRYGKVYWPVINQYEWIKSYLDVGSDIVFCGPDEVPMKEIDFVAELQAAGRSYPDISFMDAKYKLMGLDYDDWQDYFHPMLSPTQLARVYKLSVIDAVGRGDYAAVCDTFASPPDEQHITLPKIDLPVVQIRQFQNFTPFDWVSVLRDATEIHLVDTCFTYLLETINTSAKRICIYSRNYGQGGEPTWKATRHLFRGNYEWLHK